MMGVPLRYNVRSIMVRRVTSTLTVFGIALVIFALSWVLALMDGLDRALVSVVDPAIVIMIRPSALSETTSNISPEVFNQVRFQPEIALDGSGQPLASADAVVNAFLFKPNGERGGVIIRGVGREAFPIHRRIRFTRGRMFRPGSTELIIGKTLIGRFNGLGMGEKIRLARFDWTVVGEFEAGGAAAESEAWGDARQVMQGFLREAYSSFVVRLTSPAEFARFARRVEGDARINLKAWTEEGYYATQASSALAIWTMGFVIATIMGMGAIFGAMNTMYSAVVGRVRKIGTLRALGFSGGAILASFLFEAILLGVAGGAVGALLAGLFFQGQTTSVMNLRSFNEIQFTLQVTPQLLLRAFAVAGVMGIVGGLLPAIRAARLPIVRALREL
ncbi:MAG: ABC transporter permease [Candidatus Riflebacteria bacterium]|nr:ABC transporter permease [Candidatus Riflebacteria bacterium]